MAGMTDEQVKIITGMRQMIDTFCQMVVNCQDVDQLWLAFSYLGKLQEGKVLIASDVDQVPGGYTTNEVPGGPVNSVKK